MWISAVALFAIAGIGTIGESFKMGIANFIVSGIYVLIFMKSNGNIKAMEAKIQG